MKLVLRFCKDYNAPMELPLVLLADSDTNLIQELSRLLELENYPFLPCPTDQLLLEALNQSSPGLILLDRDLPRENGFATLKTVKALKNLNIDRQVAVLFTAQNPTDSHHITALELGADIFMAKPYSLKAMVLQIHALVRRFRRTSPTTYNWNGTGVTIDVLSHRVYLDDQDTQLTGTEWELFMLLFTHMGHIFSRDQLALQCLGYNPDGETRTIDTHIANLRAKVPLDGLIETIRGYGYRMPPFES